ncbi:hypothetical protein [Terrisporobacter sp.]|uniref:hypothetical protein n=1 Tax=Terrisporobacter sp. TaxID=1965305 RepID=UPI00261B7986|nr:hypothetical protein [Terrisporobacter sp.]
MNCHVTAPFVKESGDKRKSSKLTDISVIMYNLLFVSVIIFENIDMKIFKVNVMC